MSNTEPTVELQVKDEGNMLRQERLTRSLYAELGSLDGLDVQYAPAPPQPEAAKGAATEPALWVFLTTAATVTRSIFVQTLRHWAQTKRQAVHLKIGDVDVEVPKDTDEAQERIIVKLLEEHHR